MSGLLALLDDVSAIAKVAASSVDDIAASAAEASTKTAGVVIDDAACAQVEVEFFNDGAGATVPDDLMITQTVKADAAGVFTYAPPSDGWWGFAALNTADYTLPQDGEDKAVELGAVIWVHFEEGTGQ